jgi:hypothetical protein
MPTMRDTCIEEPTTSRSVERTVIGKEIDDLLVEHTWRPWINLRRADGRSSVK